MNETKRCRDCKKILTARGVWTVDPKDSKKQLVRLCEKCYVAMRAKVHGGEL